MTVVYRDELGLVLVDADAGSPVCFLGGNCYIISGGKDIIIPVTNLVEKGQELILD